MNAKRKIMIVEDDPLFCEALSDLLEKNGYKPLPGVHTYEDAKSQLLQDSPDLALIDIGLPGEKDGIELAEYLYRFTQVPVVFITGYSDGVTLQRAKKSHPNAIVLKTKPFLDHSAMIETIAQQLLASVIIAVPDEELHLKVKPRGLLLKASQKKMDTIKQFRQHLVGADKKSSRKTLIPFDSIEYIATNNKETRNTILIKPEGNIVYIYRDTLSGIEKELPDYFVKVKDSHIVNLKKVTQCVDDRILFINSEYFDVSENFRELVHEKKRIYLSHF